MTNLNALFDTLERLSHDEFERVRRFMEDRARQLAQPVSGQSEVDPWLAALDAAVAELREGLSETDLGEITAAMNAEYIPPNVLKRYDWIDEPIEDES